MAAELAPRPPADALSCSKSSVYTSASSSSDATDGRPPAAAAPGLPPAPARAAAREPHARPARLTRLSGDAAEKREPRRSTPARTRDVLENEMKRDARGCCWDASVDRVGVPAGPRCCCRCVGRAADAAPCSDEPRAPPGLGPTCPGGSASATPGVVSVATRRCSWCTCAEQIMSSWSSWLPSPCAARGDALGWRRAGSAGGRSVRSAPGSF